MTDLTKTDLEERRKRFRRWKNTVDAARRQLPLWIESLASKTKLLEQLPKEIADLQSNIALANKQITSGTKFLAENSEFEEKVEVASKIIEKLQKLQKQQAALMRELAEAGTETE
jgi:chromosome segregation ATPase